MKLTKRERVLLIGAFLIISAAIFITYVYLPLTKDIKNLQVQSDDLTLQLQEAKTTEGSIKELEDKLAVKQKEAQSDPENLLKVWDQAELLSFVENTIDGLCEKVSVDFYDAAAVENITSGEIGLKIKTDYTRLKKIWKAFEAAKYLNTLTSFEISEDVEYKQTADITEVNDPASASDITNQAGLTGDITGKDIITAKTKGKEKLFDVTMVLRFYSQNSSEGYPKEYDFMDGKFGKTNLFE